MSQRKGTMALLTRLLASLVLLAGLIAAVVLGVSHDHLARDVTAALMLAAFACVVADALSPYLAKHD